MKRPLLPTGFRPNQPFFSQTAQLPIRGQPSQLPFDDYLLWLGLSLRVAQHFQKTSELPRIKLRGRKKSG